ncbi:MAG: UDP-4-amino-4,6-dideoxy-N-acetyl-beta-L-altrosamine transaminase [Paraburkholderia sp.]|uniref:UDP-4-amino-4, 6-dideoxy-N-acetyl-beta-L-altrosamine transaminase n=1 Tax=Paraburkholderia sp. TaxID=1926495 RepID=UPI00121DF0D8|nr:UDP-4-amino-4,6-dideoxy-N-acetyl-beta-L-altrosamine transaminase [Paraburkholderia sp.]TAM06625.1 MAG: UDP-4-amino-4,6-dideoxy-N-acetyl-beta-L-altrosamine transaminase [Paraburkholderia sp.]TAM28493.1 MAG: UDP-4-amino-4,6-dideoxy-N-acetyl-beta-L-altrosamine transaminase [Paraburkholderia sp.]
MSTSIPYGRQSIDESDIAAVTRVLHSDWLTQGPAIPAFEAALAARCEAKYAVAVSNATSALHIACTAAGLGPGDLLWTTPNTFVASANCARYCGADVDFVDIDRNTWCLDANALERKLVEAERSGRLPKVVIPVAFAGRSADMHAIKRLADRFDFLVIEDASHAVGARYCGRPVGCGDHAHMTVFSFHPVKIVTTGEGGAVLTNDATLHERLRSLRSHGITRDVSRMESESDGPWYYEMTELGYNYRMTDLQAALGLSQLDRLDTFLSRRRALAARYAVLLEGLPLVLPEYDVLDESAWHLYVVRLKLDAIRFTHRDVFERMRQAGIGVNLHYIPVHLQPYYRRLGFRPGQFPESEQYYREAISLPMYAALSDDAQARVADTLKAALR